MALQMVACIKSSVGFANYMKAGLARRRMDIQKSFVDFGTGSCESIEQGGLQQWHFLSSLGRAGHGNNSMGAVQTDIT
jgi:hypothetical protein